MIDTYEKHSRAKLITTLVTVLVIAGVVVLADHLKAAGQLSPKQAGTGSATVSNVQVTPTTDTSTAPQTSASASNTNGTKDGNYSANVNYYVPHGQESLQVSLTVKNGTITDSSITNSENDGDSASFQEAFASEYKSYVVGKQLSGLRLSNVAGASDTAAAFNQAISQITSKAQA